MNEQEPAMSRKTYYAEEVTENGTYRKHQFQRVEQIFFYIRPARTRFYPCVEDQKKLRKLLSEAHWILGNDDYKPAIELNTTEQEIDDDSWKVVEEHKATKEEIDRIGVGGWENIK